jgi:response regulator of citrate/malate metabolism
MTVRVLVVEDEAIAAEAHSAYVGRLDGFEVAGASTDVLSEPLLHPEQQTLERMLDGWRNPLVLLSR